jgi:hypothetical protein
MIVCRTCRNTRRIRTVYGVWIACPACSRAPSQETGRLLDLMYRRGDAPAEDPVRRAVREADERRDTCGGT